MSEAQQDGEKSPPTSLGGRLKLIGPGIVVAVTGVGSGDLVATLVAGSKYGYALLWAAIVGCVVKIALAEAAGRYHLATGSTILDGWRALGAWTSWYFGFYIIVWGFVYGGTAMSATALPLTVLFPGVLPLWGWGMLAGLSAAAMVLFNRYAAFEAVMKFFVLAKFLIVVGLAIRVAPHLGELAKGLVPTLPKGSAIYTLGLIGGVGGTITLASYGYWVNAKGWRTPAWIPMMRFDNSVAYVLTGVFVVAMLVVGAELLYAAQIALGKGDQGLVDLGKILEQRFGPVTSKLFFVGFFAVTFSSLLGVWEGVSLLFADFVRKLRGPAQSDGVAALEKSNAFRFYVLWLTFPPMLLLLLGKPFALVIAYGAFGAFFMPFLAITLLLLLNREGVPHAWRSGVWSNGLLVVAALLFVVLCVNEIAGMF